MKLFTRLFLIEFILVLFIACSGDPTAEISGTDFLLITNDNLDAANGAKEYVGRFTIDSSSSRAVDSSFQPHSRPGYPAQHQDRLATTKLLQAGKNLNRPRSSQGLTTADKTHTFLNNGNSVEATLKYGASSGKTLIYVQNSELAKADWDKVGTFIEETLYPRVTSVFGNPTDIDANGRIVILYFDMDDDSTLGFFVPSDLLVGGDGNAMEMIYINTIPTLPEDEETYRTVAHEFQHLINYGTRVIINQNSEMELWLDEGLAEASAHLLYDKVVAYDIATFNNDRASKIANGLSLLIFENRDEDYALSYLFGQYIRCQAGSSSIYSSLINNEKSGMDAVVEVLASAGLGAEFDSGAKIMHNFRIALALGKDDSPYGFKADNDKFDLTVREPQSWVIKRLPPGGSFMFNTKSGLSVEKPSSAGDNISYINF